MNRVLAPLFHHGNITRIRCFYHGMPTYEGQGMGIERGSGLGNTGMTEEFAPGMRVEYKPIEEKHGDEVTTGVIVNVKGPDTEGVGVEYEIRNEKTGEMAHVHASKIYKEIKGGTHPSAGPDMASTVWETRDKTEK